MNCSPTRLTGHGPLDGEKTERDGKTVARPASVVDHLCEDVASRVHLGARRRREQGDDDDDGGLVDCAISDDAN
jgi:hypothetical protein